MSNLNTKYLIIGTSAAGLTAALELRKLAPNAQITCLTSESEQPYNKCFLVDYLAGERVLDTVYLYTPEFLAQQKIEILYNSTVTEIRAEIQEIQLISGALIAYDKLLIATGARAWVPPILGVAKLLAQELALNFYSLQDTIKLMAKLDTELDLVIGTQAGKVLDPLVPVEQTGESLKVATNNINIIKHVTVIGAGLTGLECADALWRRGLKVTVIDQSAQILNQVLDQDSAQFLQQKIIASGTELVLGAQVLEATELITQQNNFKLLENNFSISEFREFPSNSKIKITLNSRVEIFTDLIILATGVQANSIKIIGAQLNLIKQQIQVDQYFATNLPNIWAAGDAILVRDLVTGELRANRTWPDAILQGRLAARSMFAVKVVSFQEFKLSKLSISLPEQPAGSTVNLVPYSGQLAYYKSHMFNLDLVVCGNLNNINKNNNNSATGSMKIGAEVNCANQASWASYNYNLTEQLQGFILIGDISQGAKLRRQIGI